LFRSEMTAGNHAAGGFGLLSQIQVSGSDQANSLIFKKTWPNEMYFGVLNPLFHGRNQACEKYPALAIHKIRTPQWPMSHTYPGR